MQLELTDGLALAYGAHLNTIEAGSGDKLIKGVEKFGNKKISLNASHLDLDGLAALYNIAREADDKSVMMHITAARKVIEDPDKASISTLQALSEGIIAYLLKDVIDGWMYQKLKTGIFLPWVVMEVKYVPQDHRESPPYVRVTLGANTSVDSKGERSSVRTMSLTFNADDIVRKTTIPKLLADQDFFHESPELKANYEREEALFIEYRPMLNRQFIVSGNATETDARDAWIRSTVCLENVKAVNDEGAITRQFNEYVDASFWSGKDRKKRDIPEGVFEVVPFHPYVYMFALEHHSNFWVHASQMKPYEYDKNLRDKLVLPEVHRDLLDILTHDIGILMEDFIKGKSGGTTILCKGKPGLGKTLTAEIYSEVVEAPLYKVHAGMLGITPDSVEKNLKIILKRSERWGAILLLDEADVYIRQRGNDLEHNAVVASFLRNLEYFSGLFFMTTNRVDDVDDAIEPRCIASITYTTPKAEEATLLWTLLAAQFQQDLQLHVIQQLVEEYPNVSGRDIKEWLKLTARFAKGKELPLDFEPSA